MQVLKNNGVHGSNNDHWLTPRWIIRELGPFDLDPCCEAKMPWRTAKTMWSERGLYRPWKGRVWLNPPYSRVGPWVDAFVANGIALVSAKSADTIWFHKLLGSCSSFLLVKGRISFCFPDGTPSEGAFLSSVFFAMTKRDSDALSSFNDHHKMGARCMVVEPWRF